MQISFMGLLGILFIGLKLTGYIAWDWIWVTAPLWGGLVIALFFFAIAGIFHVLANWGR